MNMPTVLTSNTADKPPVIAVVGATASGKTATATQLASDLHGEVVSADSRYLYRGMDIGTAKPAEAELRGIPHHLIDILDPNQEYTLALYQRDTYRAINAIHSREQLPILAGGTPLYVNAVLEGWRIPEAPPDPAFRQQMEQIAASEGNETLHRRLVQIDPVAAGRIPPANLRRIIRALEIHRQTGQRMTDLEGKDPPPYRIFKIGLTLPREDLFARIDARVEEMIRAGLVDEVQHLLAHGVRRDAPAMSAIGYPEIVACLDGQTTLEEAIERIKFHTHRYARHQLTWLRRMDDVLWVDPRESGWYDRVLQQSERFVNIR